MSTENEYKEGPVGKAVMVTVKTCIIVLVGVFLWLAGQSVGSKFASKVYAVDGKTVSLICDDYEYSIPSSDVKKLKLDNENEVFSEDYSDEVYVLLKDGTIQHFTVKSCNIKLKKVVLTIEEKKLRNLSKYEKDRKK